MIVSAFVPLCPHAHLFTRIGIPVRYVYDTDKSESKIKRTTKAARKKYISFADSEPESPQAFKDR